MQKIVVLSLQFLCYFFFFQAEDGIRDWSVTGVQTCALPISADSWIVSMSVRTFSHSSKVSPLDAKNLRILAESQFMTFSINGTSTLMALSLSTVRLATRVMNLASLTAIVRPSYWLTCIITGKSELPSPM